MTARKFTPQHIWIQSTGQSGEYSLGLSEQLQNLLGQIVYIELSKSGDQLNRNDVCAVIESRKSIIDVETPIAGEVTQANEQLLQNPQLINLQPFESWLFRFKPNDISQLDTLLDYEPEISL
ncbi:glycine cleavage system protein H [Pragia fontium]|uniref:glycine cleavage system protein H n=1 Tax=Pragia fontium TaxID=82985 RepID=UPI000F6E07C4|nr:glycine cleavage system protein H [Pragia fontium]VEJ56334.1 Glycine cleavage system H protein [Pragia fontium]